MLDPVLELAENANTYTPLGPSDERIVTDRWVLWMGRADHPSWNVAQRFRFRPDELDEVRAEIHAAVRARRRTGCTWEVGSSATPTDLVDRLLALGLVFDDDPFAVGMVLTESPADAPPANVEVRRVTTAEEALVAAQIAAVAFGMAEPVPAPVDPEGRSVRYLAYVDGEPVASGDIVFLPFAGFLSGASTLRDFRGRGIYRALVRARWDEAVRRGTPALLIGAGNMSRPIVERIGFRAVAEQHLLLDRSTSS